MILVGTFVFLVGIAGLFVFNWDRKVRTSLALWLPVLWLLIVGSRPVSAWLQGGAVSQDIVFEDGSPIDRNIFLALIVLGLIVLLIQRTAAVAKVLGQNWPIVFFFAYCAISVAWSDFPEVAAKRWVKSLGDLIMVLIVLTETDRLSAIKRVLARVGFLLLPLSIVLIKYYPDLGRAYSRWEGRAFYVGVSADKNMLGMACMMFGLGAIWRFIHEWKGTARRNVLMAQGTVAAMALWLIVTADSMTSLSCFLFGAGLMVATCFRSVLRNPKRIHLMVAAGLLLSSSVLFLNFGGNVLAVMGRNSTLTGRTQLWEELLRMNRSPVVGTGFESFWSPERADALTEVLQWTPNEAHNGYLEVFLNLGWLGILLLAIIILSGYRTILRSLKSDSEIGRLQLAYFSVALAYSFTEAGFRNLTPIWIAFLIAVIRVPELSMSSRIRKPKTFQQQQISLAVDAEASVSR